MASPSARTDPPVWSPSADDLPVGVAVVDPSGRQTYVNPVFARMVGWPREELIGATAPFVYWPPEELGRIDEAFRQTIAGTAPATGFELRFQRVSGERFDVLISISTVKLETGLCWVAVATEISKQKAAETELLDREQRLSLAMSAGRLGSWEFNVRTGQVIWSETLERIHGLEPGTFGGTFDDYKSDIHPDDVEYVLGTIERSSHGDIPHRLEYRILVPNGEVRWLEASGQLFRDADGAPLRMLGVCSDITERKAADEIARQAREDAEHANRSKSDFLAAMSHELRTPLNGIGGYVDLLDLGIHGPVTDKQRGALASIKRNQDQLLTLINDLLKFAQIEAGRLSFDVRDVEVAGFLARIRPLIEPQAEAQGIGFEIDDVIPCPSMRADEDRLQQIMLNIVGNAAKFTEAGGRIRVWCEAGDGRVRIRVSDTGRGIPADRLESIFDPFVQIERRSAANVERGVGLGLAISRDLARGMRGDVTVESELGRGSTFTVELPAA